MESDPRKNPASSSGKGVWAEGSGQRGRELLLHPPPPSSPSRPARPLRSPLPTPQGLGSGGGPSPTLLISSSRPSCGALRSPPPLGRRGAAIAPSHPEPAAALNRGGQGRAGPSAPRPERIPRPAPPAGGWRGPHPSVHLHRGTAAWYRGGLGVPEHRGRHRCLCASRRREGAGTPGIAPELPRYRRQRDTGGMGWDSRFQAG